MACYWKPYLQKYGCPLIAGWFKIIFMTYTASLYATSWKVGGLIPDEVTEFFNWPNPSSCTMAPWLTQPLTEMHTRNLPGGKGWPARGADNLTIICEAIV
jgi:hypothetical protein